MSVVPCLLFTVLKRDRSSSDKVTFFHWNNIQILILVCPQGFLSGIDIEWYAGLHPRSIYFAMWAFLHLSGFWLYAFCHRRFLHPLLSRSYREILRFSQVYIRLVWQITIRCLVFLILLTSTTAVAILKLFLFENNLPYNMEIILASWNMRFFNMS